MDPLAICSGMPETNFLHPKEYKASLTGVTKLKEGKYTSRYRVSNGYAVTARGELIVKPRPDPPSKLPRPRKDTAGSAPLAEEDPKKRGYRVAKQIVKNRIRAMVNMLQHSRDKIGTPRLHFWTITFNPSMTDDLCYRALNSWLTSLRQLGRLRSYLWVAERQKQGTIHYHLAIPHFLDVKYANRIMRNILLDLEQKKLLQGWSREGIRKYNGVDIAKDRNSKRIVNFASGPKGKSLANYLTKYVTKNDTELPHLAWHNSRDWSALILGMTFTREELGRFVTGSMIDVNFIETEYCQFYRWKNFQPPERFVKHLGQMNYELCFFVTGRIGNYLYELN